MSPSETFFYAENRQVYTLFCGIDASFKFENRRERSARRVTSFSCAQKPTFSVATLVISSSLKSYSVISKVFVFFQVLGQNLKKDVVYSWRENSEELSLRLQ